MGKASRTKRRRAAVRAAQRTRTNTWWYGLIGVIVVLGVALIVVARGNGRNSVGPTLSDHWHAALGVYDCDHWVGDAAGPGLWQWPAATANQAPARVGTGAYAGLHSHADGVIHMEPQTSDEEGRHATLGKYFDFGGWKLSSTGYAFVGTKVANGEKCADKPGTLIWGTAKWNGTDGPQKFTVRKGNPAAFKLHDADVVIVAFVTKGTALASLGNPPSLSHLGSALNAETPPGQTPTTMPPVATTVPAPPSSAETQSSTPGTPTS